MSSYEDYTQKSGNYDKTREPVGTEIIVGCFAHAPVPLDRMRVLDAGSGTGSYSQALLAYVGRIEAVDLNPGMLEVAARKLAGPRAEGRISFHAARIDELPFEDAALDGIMINQVLHHLPDEASQGFPAHRQVFREFARVLKPGGVFSMIEASDPKGWWLRPLYLLHLKLVLPLVERILLRGAQDFSMIGTYSTNFGSAAEIAAMLGSHGLEVKFSKYFFGCATGVAGRKIAPTGRGTVAG